MFKLILEIFFIFFFGLSSCFICFLLILKFKPRDHLATILNVTIPSLFDETRIRLVLSVPLYKGDDVRTKERCGLSKNRLFT